MILSQYRPERMVTDCGKLRVAVGNSPQLFLRLNVGKIRFLQNLDQVRHPTEFRISEEVSKKAPQRCGASLTPGLPGEVREPE